MSDLVKQTLESLGVRPILTDADYLLQRGATVYMDLKESKGDKIVSLGLETFLERYESLKSQQ